MCDLLVCHGTVTSVSVNGRCVMRYNYNVAVCSGKVNSVTHESSRVRHA